MYFAFQFPINADGSIEIHDSFEFNPFSEEGEVVIVRLRGFLVADSPHGIYGPSRFSKLTGDREGVTPMSVAIFYLETQPVTLLIPLGPDIPIGWTGVSR